MAVLVFDSTTETWEKRSAADATKALRLSNFSLEEGDYTLVGPDGQAFNAQASEVYKFLQDPGFRLESEEEEHQRYLNENYGGAGGTALAVGTGALSGATLGLSDLAGSQLGLREELTDIREASPTAHLVGTAGGAIGAGLATGGMGAVGGAARLLPAAQAIKAGVATTRALGGRGAVAKATGLATEGALMGTGTAISELSLGPPPETAEAVLTEMAAGAAFGGLAGGVLGFGASGLGNLRKVVADRRASAKEAAKVLSAHKGEPITEEMVKKAGWKQWSADKFGAAIAGVTGRPGNRRTISEIFEATQRQRELGVEDFAHAMDTHTNNIGRLAEAQISSYDDAVSLAIGADKLKKLSSLLPADQPGLGKASMVAEGVLEEMDQMVGEALEQGNILPVVAKRLRDSMAQTQSRYWDRDGSLRAVFEELDRFSSDVGRESAKAARLAKDLSGEHQADFLKSLHARIGRHLTENFGEAGRLRRVLHDAADADLSASKALRNEYFVSQEMPGLNVKLLPKDAKFTTAVRNLHQDSNTELRRWREYLNAQENRFRTHLQHLDLDARELRIHREALDDIGKLRKGLEKAGEQMTAIRRQQATEGIMGGVGNFGIMRGAFAGTVAASMAGDPGNPWMIGGGAVAGALAQPGMLVRRLVQFNRSVQSSRARVKSAANRLVQPFQADRTKKFLNNRNVVRAGVIGASGLAAKNRRKDRYAKAMETRKFVDNLAPIMNDPGAAVEALGEQFSAMAEVAPQVTEHMNQTRIMAAGFLYEKATVLNITGRNGHRITQSDTNQIRFDRYREAVNYPHRILERIANGTARSEDMEVLQEVYPILLQQVLFEVQTALAQNPGELDPQAAAQLSALFGGAWTPLYEKATIDRLQGVHAVAGGQPDAPQGSQSGRPQTQGKRRSVMRENQTRAERIESL